jgi:hypothetical protein
MQVFALQSPDPAKCLNIRRFFGATEEEKGAKTSGGESCSDIVCPDFNRPKRVLDLLEEHAAYGYSSISYWMSTEVLISIKPSASGLASSG